MAGGFTGGIAAAMLNGVKRGLFSNEAGMGSAPNVAATATVTHPVKQGLIQSLGVFVDTMIICTATALIVLVSGPEIYDPHAPAKMAGASLTASAVAASLGPWTTWLMTVLVFVFAFSSVLGNYVYAEINLFFLGAGQRAINIFRVLVLGAIALGAVAKLSTVWDVADISMGLMAIVNLIAIVLLGKWAFALLRNYHLQAEAGEDPVFVNCTRVADLAMHSVRHDAASTGSVCGAGGSGDGGDASRVLCLLRHHVDPRFRKMAAVMSSVEIVPMPYRLAEAKDMDCADYVEQAMKTLSALPSKANSRSAHANSLTHQGGIHHNKIKGRTGTPSGGKKQKGNSRNRISK
jgi:hypothetical protein